MELKFRAGLAAAIFVNVLLLAAVAVCSFLPGIPKGVLPLLAMLNGLLLLSSLLGFHFYSRFSAARDKALYYDSFTGMPNEKMFQEDLGRMPAGEGRVYVMICLCGFHELNSLFGLNIGGKTIQRLCPALKRFAEKHAGFAYRVSPHVRQRF